jgi:MFS family permease
VFWVAGGFADKPPSHPEHDQGAFGQSTQLSTEAKHSALTVTARDHPRDVNFMQDLTPGPAVAPEATGATPATTSPGAAFALAVLFSMNLLNYVDRYVFSSVGPAVIRDLHLSDSGFGILNAAFMVVYTLVSPLVGWMGDRYERRRLLGFGVGLWSLATVGTAFAANFGEMFLARALLGVGEASYGVVAPPLLADLFAPRHRGRVMGIFYLALPLGGALGYGVGGMVAKHWGWRTAFWVVGLPGLVVALAGLRIRDPGRGASEGGAGGRRPGIRDYAALVRTPSLLYNIAGMAAVTFTTGGYAVWAPTFYNRVRGMELHHANLLIGVLTAVAGLLGIALSAWWADRLLRVTRRAYLLWASLAVLASVPLGLAGLLDPDPRSSMALMFVAMVLMASVLGPCNTVTANVVPATQRAAAFAASIFLIHLFGDISSPILMGKLSDVLGTPEVAVSPIGRMLAALGARPVATFDDKAALPVALLSLGPSVSLGVPVPVLGPLNIAAVAAFPIGRTNLTAGMLLVVPVLLLGGLFFLLGSRHLPADQDRAHPASAEPPSNGPPLH